jgi:hypothetical protein
MTQCLTVMIPSTVLQWPSIHSPNHCRERKPSIVINKTTTSRTHPWKQPILLQQPKHQHSILFPPGTSKSQHLDRQHLSPPPIPSSIPSPSHPIPRLSPIHLTTRSRTRKLGTQALSFGLQRYSANEPPPATWHASNRGKEERRYGN